MAITRAALVRKLTKCGYQVVGSSATAEKAWEELNTHSVDIVLLDIDLAGKQDGVWLGNKIKNDLNIPFVYLTAYGDASTLKEVVDSKPNGYLNKPYNEASLLTSLTIALHNFEENQWKENDKSLNANKVLYVKDGHVMVKIRIPEILFVQSDGNYIKIQTVNSKHLIREKLSDFLTKLPEKVFKRVHNRYIANMTHVDQFKTNELVISNVSIPISAKYKNGLIQE